MKKCYKGYEVPEWTKFLLNEKGDVYALESEPWFCGIYEEWDFDTGGRYQVVKGLEEFIIEGKDPVKV